MCAADRCQCYGKNWTCPPACGTIEEATLRADPYRPGIIVQSVGQLEDDFDFESMEATAELHRQRFQKLVDGLKKEWPAMLPMGAGACTPCERCTYPDEPCRFPDEAIPSMEAYGLFVSQVCTASGMDYNHGKLTVTYTSCILLA